ILGLADVENLAARADHAVNAGGGRRKLAVLRDDGSPESERELLRRLLIRHIGKALLFVLVRELDVGFDILLQSGHGSFETLRCPVGRMRGARACASTALINV